MDNTGAVALAVHRICPACGEPTTGADVRPVEQVLVCNLCGTATRFGLLPPLLFLTGASGSGKTTIYQALLGTITEAILIDADLLWGVDPAHDDPGSDYRQFRGLVLHLAERLARNGRPVLVEGSCMPHQYETLGERWYFAKSAYLATVCSDDELVRRLRARPPWRRHEDRLEVMVDWNRQLREGTIQTDPPIDVLDTTGRPIDDCAHETLRWIRSQIGH